MDFKKISICSESGFIPSLLNSGKVMNSNEVKSGKMKGRQRIDISIPLGMQPMH